MCRGMRFRLNYSFALAATARVTVNTCKSSEPVERPQAACNHIFISITAYEGAISVVNDPGFPLFINVR